MTTELQTAPLCASFDPARYSRAGTARLGSTDYVWSIWDGQQLRKHFALDTETDLATDHHIPSLAMVTVSDGITHLVIRPNDVSEFLMQHLPYGHHIVAHNVAFDFWVLDRYLNNNGHHEARNWLWAAVDEQRVHDTMLLGGLVQLAKTDQDTLRGLAELAEQHCGIELDKSDPYRTRYAETIGQPWDDLEHGFFSYAIKDAIATYQLFCKLTAEAKQITDDAGVNRQFGFLTEAVQVKAAVALSVIYRNGLAVDLDKATQLRDDIEQHIQRLIQSLQEQTSPDLFHRYKKTGNLKINKEKRPAENESVDSHGTPRGSDWRRGT